MRTKCNGLQMGDDTAVLPGGLLNSSAGGARLFASHYGNALQGRMKLVGWVRASASLRYAGVLECDCFHEAIRALQCRKAASGDLSGRDFGAGREESPEGCARGRKGEMPERRVFKLTAGSKGKGTGIPAVYKSCFARVERLLRDGRVDACRFDGFHNKGGAC